MLKGDIKYILVIEKVFFDIIREIEGFLENSFVEKMGCCVKMFVL